MRQYPKYQTICDYAPTISHDMSVTHDIKRCETPMQKLKEIIAALLGGIKTPKTYVFGVLFICSYRRDIMVSD
jgi:hypothetical protein